MILLLGYCAVVFVVVGIAYRGLKIKRMPVHLRWELAPVPHEAGGRAKYGGSYLEEFEWWTKPREKSLINEAFYMFQEIVFLKGVWEHNRALWVFSFPFHFGLYLLAGMAGCLVLVAFGLSFLAPVALALGGAGYALGVVGTIGLLAKRTLDPKLSPFSTPATYFNLVFLMAMFLTGGMAMLGGEFVPGMTAYVKAFFAGNTGVALGGALGTHVAIGMLFLIYLPFTYMMHFVAKYFTYHEVRWNDEPMAGNAAMGEKVKKLLGQSVTWSAPHLGADGKKNWVDIVTSPVPKEGK